MDMDWTPLAEILVSERFVFGYCVILVIYAICWTIQFLRRRHEIGKHLKLGLRTVKRTKDEEDFLRKFPQIDREISEIPTLSDQWNEFKESFLFPREDADQVIRNSRDPSSYFDVSSVIDSTIHLRFYGSVPGQLTGLGILGTFLGLAAGITLARTNLASTDTALLQQSLGRLLDGASLAFLTSITGLLTSILFLILERTQVGQLYKLLDDWISALDERLRRVTPEQLADEHLVQLKDQTVQLQRFNTDLATSIAVALDEKIAGSIGPTLNRLAAAVEGLRTDQREANEEVLQSLVTEFGDAMTGAAGQELDALSSSLGRLNEAVDASMRGMAEQQRQVRSSMEALGETVQSAVSNSSSRMREDVGEAISELTTAMSSSMAEFRREVESAGSSTSETVTEAVEELARQMRTSVGEVSDELGSSSARMARQLESAGSSAARRLDETSDEVVSRVQKLNESFETSEELVLQLGQASEMVRNAAESLGQTTEGFNTILPSLEGSSEAIQSAGEEIQKSLRALSDLASRVQQSSRDLRETQERTAESWRLYSERFEGTDESLARVFQEIHDGLDRYTERIRDFTQEVDRNLASAVETLTAVVRELDDAIVELPDVLRGTTA